MDKHGLLSCRVSSLLHHRQQIFRDFTQLHCCLFHLGVGPVREPKVFTSSDSPLSEPGAAFHCHRVSPTQARCLLKPNPSYLITVCLLCVMNTSLLRSSTHVVRGCSPWHFKQTHSEHITSKSPPHLDLVQWKP